MIMMLVKAGFRQGQSLSRKRNWSSKSSMTDNVVKIQEIYKFNRIGVRRNRMFPFIPTDSIYDCRL